MTPPLDRPFAALLKNMSSRHEYEITPQLMDGFVALFDDRNPLHMDVAYAKNLGHPDRVVHGAILSGFLSHFVGMVLPGRRAMLLSSDLRFAAPNHIGDTLRLTGKIMGRAESTRTVEMMVRFENLTKNRLSARGKVFVQVHDG
jgi:3-hydroxybutyryl-CoA dehydratase